MVNVGSYFRPQTIGEVYELLSNRKNPTKVLAGGTDLLLHLHKASEPVDIVDIGDIPQLKTIEEHEDEVRFGSMATFTQIQTSEIILKNYRALAKAAAMVGSPQIRNQGTIVGNIANASPAADSVPALVAVDAQVLVASSGSQRWEKIVDLLAGINKVNLAGNEIILGISFKKIPGLRSGFAKLGRRNALAISRLSAAVGIVAENNIITQARVALGAVAPNPFRSHQIENSLIGKSLDEAISDDVLETASAVVAEKLGNRTSAPYKRQAIKGIVRQALEDALDA